MAYFIFKIWVLTHSFNHNLSFFNSTQSSILEQESHTLKWKIFARLVCHRNLANKSECEIRVKPDYQENKNLIFV